MRMDGIANGTRRTAGGMLQPRRPRVSSTDRAAAILAASADLFLEHGYGGVAIDDIIAVTGGSKREIYALFGGKAGLFTRVVDQLCHEWLASLRRLPAPDGSLGATLSQLGHAFLTFLLSPPAIALHRLAVTEGRRFPDVAETVLRQGPTACYAVAAEALRAHRVSDEGWLADCDLAARLFLDSMTGDLQLRCLVGNTIGPGEVNARVQAAVAVFAQNAPQSCEKATNGVICQASDAGPRTHVSASGILTVG